MSQSLLRRHVEFVYALADVPMARPPGIGPIAVALLGPDVFDVPTGPLVRGRTAQLVRRGGHWGIRAFEACPRAELALGVALALADWYGVQFQPDEPFDRGDFAGHLLLPDDAVHDGIDANGYDAADFARLYCLPERIANGRIRNVCAPDQSGAFSRIGLMTAG